MNKITKEFFNCHFLWSADEIRSYLPYYIFQDSYSDPFSEDLFKTCLGFDKNIATARSIEEIGRDTKPVFMEAPVWSRNYEQLAAAGICGQRARVLLYFDGDPTGYWDFAKACGPSLGRVMTERRLDAAALQRLADYSETWLGARIVGPRLLPMPAFTVRDYGELRDANLPAIARVMSVLSDDESRATYARILFGSNEDLFAAFAERVFGPQQYMEIVKLQPGDAVVNCGVGRGWEIPYFLCMTEGEGQIFNFDPNIVWPFTPYGEFIERFRSQLSEHEIILGSHDGFVEMPISTSNMVRSDEVGREMAEQGVPTVRYTSKRLDTLTEAGLFERIDYLKMDVEGGERAILGGAWKSIERFRPKLAVAIYHEAQHFWEYPNLLIERLKDYRFYIRQYGYSRFETLLYAIPAEDAESRSGQEGMRARFWSRSNCGGALTTYLRDREIRPRYYAGGRRLMTRFSGRAWADGEIKPSPLIDTDDVIAVFEDGEGATFIAVHDVDTPAPQIVVARSRDRATLSWIAAQGVTPEAHCLPAPSAQGKPGFAIYLPSQDSISIYGMEGEEPVALANIYSPSAPFAVLRGKRSGDFLVMLGERGGTKIATQNYKRGGIWGEPTHLDLPGALSGLMLAEKTGAQDAAELCLAVTVSAQDPPQVVALSLAGEVLGQVDLDPRLEIVSTFRSLAPRPTPSASRTSGRTGRSGP